MANITEFVIRPGLGRVGRPIRLRTNYFEITNLPSSNIHHYDIVISPEVPPTLNRRIFQVAENSFSDILRAAVFDGRRNVYTIRPFPFGDACTLDVELPEDNANNVGRRPPRIFKISIKKVNEINMEEINRFLNGRGSISPNILTGIMALNVLIHNKPSKVHIKVGRVFYTNQGSQSLSGGVEVWQGYFQSIRPTPKKLMINVDLHATTFYESGSLVQLVVKILGKMSVEDLRRIQERDRTKLEKWLKNLKIYVAHRGNSIRRFKISKLTNTPASSTMFEVNGQQIDIVTYYNNTYGRSLQYPFLPCVVVRKETYLPMEVCNVVEGQRYMHKLNERQMADMIKFTCEPPQSRANKITQGIQILDYRQNEYLQQFDFRVSTEMTITQARVLPAPTLHYHPASKEDTFIPKDGSWNMRNKKVATGATLGSWACAVFGSERDYPMATIQKFIRELVTTCQDAGMNIPNKNPPIQHCNPQGGIENSLKQAWVKAGNSAKSKPQLILCILPNTGVLYAEIKRVGDTVIGVATQCVQSRHVMRAVRVYCVNVCLKINVKLGGVNSFIDPSQMTFITQRPTIIMGADVTHPAPGEQNTGRPSIAAVVASMDAKASRYAASIRVQTGRQEVISDLAEMIKELLKTFYMTCGRKPERILFYRDGVSEGQFSIVLNDEIRAIKAACKSLDEKYRPTITFIVVQKRHHTRFFPIDTRDGDRTGNCPSGTVVDSTIVHPFEFDFYLQSHPSLQGISRPIHYHVLSDENGFNADLLQTLTYNLCYNFARCTRAVSIVPPVYYAYLVCRRARFYYASSENWSDPDTPEGVGSASFAVVKSELLKTMYFI